MLRPCYSICFFFFFIWLHINPHCLLFEPVWSGPQYFQSLPWEVAGFLLTNSSPKAGQSVRESSHTPLCTQGRRSERQNTVYLSVRFLTKNWADKYGFPSAEQGALFTVLTCPVYAQRLMLFANHILWKLTNGARHATLWVCQLPSQQPARSLTVCGSARKQLSLSICLAVTFSNTCDLCLHAWGLSSLRGLPSSLWTDK